MAVFVETYFFGRKSKFWVRFEVAHLMCCFRAADDPTRVRFEVVHLVYMFGDANGPNRDRFEVAHLVCMFGAANDPIRVRMGRLLTKFLLTSERPPRATSRARGLLPQT